MLVFLKMSPRKSSTVQVRIPTPSSMLHLRGDPGTQAQGRAVNVSLWYLRSLSDLHGYESSEFLL